MKSLLLALSVSLVPAMAQAATYDCTMAQVCQSQSGDQAAKCADTNATFRLGHGGTMAPVTLRFEGRAPERYLALGPSGGAVMRAMGQPGTNAPLKSIVLFEDLNVVVTSSSGAGDARKVEMMTGHCKKAAE